MFAVSDFEYGIYLRGFNCCLCLVLLSVNTVQGTKNRTLFITDQSMDYIKKIVNASE